MKMNKKIAITKVLVAIFVITTLAAVISQSFSAEAPNQSRYMPQYTATGEMILPPNNIWRDWVFVGSPLTPNALNGGKAGFPEYHNVYIQPWAYAEYKKTNAFPEGTIMFKELQLTKKPGENPDGSRTEPSGRGYFPGAFNGADVTVKDSKRFAASGLGLLRFQPFRTKGSDRQGKGKGGMRLLSYRRREEGPSLDTVLPPTGQVVLRPVVAQLERDPGSANSSTDLMEDG